MDNEIENMKLWADYGVECYKFTRENWWPLMAALNPKTVPDAFREVLLRGLSKIRLGPTKWTI